MNSFVDLLNLKQNGNHNNNEDHISLKNIIAQHDQVHYTIIEDVITPKYDISKFICLDSIERILMGGYLRLPNSSLTKISLTNLNSFFHHYRWII